MADLEPLTELERELLAMESQWWHRAGAKDAAVREHLGMTPTAYYRAVNALIDKPAALAADPLLVKRLRRRRQERLAWRGTLRLSEG